MRQTAQFFFAIIPCRRDNVTLFLLLMGSPDGRKGTLLTVESLKMAYFACFFRKSKLHHKMAAQPNRLMTQYWQQIMGADTKIKM